MTIRVLVFVFPWLFPIVPQLCVVLGSGSGREPLSTLGSGDGSPPRKQEDTPRRRAPLHEGGKRGLEGIASGVCRRRHLHLSGLVDPLQDFTAAMIGVGGPLP
jgi:hypothetical protein